MNRDDLYALPRERVGEFAFDDAVASVFPDMIARSVPGYASVLSMIEQLSTRFVTADSNVYDLGCSLGAATLLIRERAPASCVVHAVDSSPAMVRRLKQRLEDLAASDGHPRCAVRIQQTDLREIVMSRASFVVLNWTLQFIRPDQRGQLLQAIYDAMLPGGALLLSEKICFDEPSQQALLETLHHDFKRAHGYSDLEISQKRAAIEKRLIPESLAAHMERLQGVGFRQVIPWFQCFNFVSLLAVKGSPAETGDPVSRAARAAGPA